MIDEATKQRFREDGATLIKNWLNPQQMGELHDAFLWNVANPGPHVFNRLDGTELQTHIDNANPHAKDKFDQLVAQLPFADLYAELWDSEHVWYYAEEVFLKDGGASGRGPWHQDTSVMPLAGEHWGNAWISFQNLPKKNSLEIIRASHHGVRYDGASFSNADDPTDPAFGDGTLPRLPHIDRDLAQDPNSWDVMSWAVEPGDIVALHPSSLHGGAGVDQETPTRHTLVLRFFGDDATFRALPESNPHYARNGALFKEEMAKLDDGDPFRSPIFRQLR